MNQTIQPGMHPDAEILAAFAEQSLPAAEREQIFTHMATCSRCREIVFLAQGCAEVEQRRAVSVGAEVPSRRRNPWLSGWQWAWLPAGAFAMFLGVAVMHQVRGGKAAPALPGKDPLRTSEAQAVAPSPLSNSALKQAQRAEPSKARGSSLLRDEQVSRQADRKKSSEPKDSSATAADSSSLNGQGTTAASIQGMMASQAKSSSLDGPTPANSLKDTVARRSPQQVQRQDEAINSPTPNAPLPRASESTGIQLQSLQTQPRPMPAKPDVKAAAHGTLQKSSATDALAANAPRFSLPNGLEALSSASMSTRTIALDMTGALFMSDDAGKHWQSIEKQWTGHAVLVRTRPTEAQFSTSAGAQAMRFELVSDKLQTWVSADGKTWTAQPLPVK
jgi:hypothetical protein